MFSSLLSSLADCRVHGSKHADPSQNKFVKRSGLIDPATGYHSTRSFLLISIDCWRTDQLLFSRPIYNRHCSLSVSLGSIYNFTQLAWLHCAPSQSSSPKVSIVLVLLISLLAACRGFGEPLALLRFLWAHLSAACCWCSVHRLAHLAAICCRPVSLHHFISLVFNRFHCPLQKCLNPNSESVLIKSHMAVFSMSTLGSV